MILIHTVIHTAVREQLETFLLQSLENGCQKASGSDSPSGEMHSEIILPGGNGSILLLGRSFDAEHGKQKILLEVPNLGRAKEVAAELGIKIEQEFYSPSYGQLGIFSFEDSVEVTLVELSGAANEFSARPSCAQLYISWLTSLRRNSQLKDLGVQLPLAPAVAVRSAPAPASVKPKPKPVWDPPKGTLLPNIRTKVLHNGKLRPMQVNTSVPIPFNTDMFEGQVLLIVNSAAETREPFASLFKVGKYKFELQVQGKFKKIPEGPIFFGGEITKKMELGMITRGICGGLLQMGRAINAYMHHSFGDKNNVELPHITGPFWSSVDRLHVTPAGQTPPAFIESFPEEAKLRSARKGNPEYTVEVDLRSTYSFSLKTSKMDLEEWAIVTSSYTKPMHLNMFWADADLRFVCYSVPAKAAGGVECGSNGLPKVHPQAGIDHFFSLEVQHVSNHVEWEDDSPMLALSAHEEAALGRSGSHEQLFTGYESVRLQVQDLLTSPGRRGSDVDVDDCSPRMSLVSTGSCDTEESDFHDALDGTELEFTEDPFEKEGPSDEEGGDGDDDGDVVGRLNGRVPPLLEPSRAPHSSQAAQVLAEESSEEVSALLREKLSLLQDRIMSHSAKHLSESKTGPFSKKKPHQDPVIISTKVTRSLVAAVLEIDDDRRRMRGKRRTLYAFLANPTDLAADTMASPPAPASGRHSRRYVLHSFGEWKKALPLVKQSAVAPCQSRYSDDMKRKALMSHSYESILQGPQYTAARNTLMHFLEDSSHNSSFLAPNDKGVGSKRLRESLPAFNKESLVCVQQSNYYWSQECMGLSAEELIFVKPSKLLGTAVRLRIPLSDITSVRKVADADHPLPIPGYFCLMVATFARQYTVLLRGAAERDAWNAAMQAQLFALQGLHGRFPSRDYRDSEAPAPLSLSMSTLKRTSTSDVMANAAQASMLSLSITALPASHLEGMISYPPDWNLGDKMILNGRNFTCSGVYHQLSMRTLELGGMVNSPCKLVAKLLEMAFQLSSEEAGAAEGSGGGSADWAPGAQQTVYMGRADNLAPEPVDFQSLWVDFMDGVSLLQCIDLSLVDHSSPEATCLFLNLYHCLLIHAYLVVGLPNSLFKWSNFFRFCSYEAFGDIFSLAELEHCILRGGEFNFKNIDALIQLIVLQCESPQRCLGRASTFWRSTF